MAGVLSEVLLRPVFGGQSRHERTPAEVHTHVFVVLTRLLEVSSLTLKIRYHRSLPEHCPDLFDTEDRYAFLFGHAYSKF